MLDVKKLLANLQHPSLNEQIDLLFRSAKCKIHRRTYVDESCIQCDFGPSFLHKLLVAALGAASLPIISSILDYLFYFRHDKQFKMISNTPAKSIKARPD